MSMPATAKTSARVLMLFVGLTVAIAWTPSALGQGTLLATYGQPAEGPWEEIFRTFCAERSCRHVDTDMSSAQAIAKFLSERGRPVATSTEVGVLFGPMAVRQEAALPYKNAHWAHIPDWAKDADGHWFGVYAGVPTFLVNPALVETVPKTWEDLLKPQYRNAIAIKDPRESGTAMAMLLAATIARGGGAGNMTPGIAYFRQLYQSGNIKAISPSAGNIQRGQVPITIRYDHENLITRERLRGELALEVIIPEDGSVYTPSVIVLNRFAPDPALARAFADFLGSDRGQLILARSLARPIRALAGNLDVPADVRARWLPEELYRGRVRTLTNWSAFPVSEIRERWTREVLAR